jgi:hypothetical protein
MELTSHLTTSEKSLTSKKNIFVILGVARSGTSVLARALKALGIELGNKLTQPGKWNPTGFWEDNDIVYKINQHLFNQLHFRWDSIKLFENHNDQEKMKTMQDSAAHIIQERFQYTDYWGFKDPRTARILPFWQTIFTTLNLNEHYVIALRNPLCSASSLNDLGQKDIEKGLLLWLMHLIPSIEQTHGKKRIVVCYEKTMQDPKHQLERIQRYLNLPAVSKSELEQFAEHFLNQSLDHYPFTYVDLVSHPAAKVSPLILQCYNCLLKLAHDEISFEDAEFVSTWAAIKQEFIKNYPHYTYIDNLLAENTTLQKKLRSIQRSPSWKLIYPLRLIEKVISALRKKIKWLYLFTTSQARI